MKVKLLTSEKNIEEMIKNAAMIANVSRRRYPNEYEINDAVDLLIKIAGLGHYAVFEHINLSFLITDISKVCASQMRTHRTMSIVEHSYRPKHDIDVDDFIVFKWADDLELNEEIDTVYNQIIEVYNKLQKYYKPEDCRYILPVGIVTTIGMTVDLRNLMNFLKLRLDYHAASEVRQVAWDIKSLLTTTPYLSEIVDVLCEQLID